MKSRFKFTIKSNDCDLVPYLKEKTELSVQKIKLCIRAGGCWIKRKNTKKLLRSKKLKKILQPGDFVELCYDENALTFKGESPFLLFENKSYGFYYKPQNVLSQPSPFGDVSSMEHLLKPISDRPIFIIHRLDREASGIMTIAYTKNAAQKLSAIWNTQDVTKTYQAQVLGHLEPKSGQITQRIKGKPATTNYEVIKQLETTSLVQATIETGRYHQIRRHLSHIGNPVMGDPRYGRKNYDERGLRLVASEIQLTCPFSKKVIHQEIPSDKKLW